jgi:hypothetical protein
MGIINQGILGSVSGTVGNVVGGTWKGIPYLRIKASGHNDANTAAQIIQRIRFAACVELAKSLLDVLVRPIWDKKAVKMSGFNYFVQTNLDAFDQTGQLTLPENLSLSVGDLPVALNFIAQNAVAGNGAMLLSWTDNSGVGSAAATDKLNVVAVSDGDFQILQGLNYTRSAGAANIQVPFASGAVVHLYIFFSNVGNTKYSPDSQTQVIIPTTPTP